MDTAYQSSSRTRSPSRTFRVLLAVAISFLMVASTGALIVSSNAQARPAGLQTPLASAAVLTGVETGAQLRAGPITTEPGTPLQYQNNTHDLGAVAPTYPMMFTVGFQMRNSNLLAQTILAQSSPSSPQFHQWLTLDQERTFFGPDPVAYQNTINYFTSLGLKVQTEGLLSVSFSGTAAQIDLAMGTRVDSVAYGYNGSSAAMNVEPLSLPVPIAGAISSLNGLDQSQVAHPTSEINPEVAQDISLAQANGDTTQLVPVGAVPATGTPAGNLSTVFNVSNRGFFWIYYYSPSRHLYREFQVITPGALNYLYNGSTLINEGINGDSTGTPIRIAIVMAGGINPTDMQGYSSLAWNNPNQILNRLTAMPVDGAFTTNGTVTWTDGASSEMALDIEFSSTMAPGAHIMPVYGPGLFTNVLDDDYAMLESQPGSNLPNIISNSWGGSEDTFSNFYGPDWSNTLTMHNYFMLLTGRGSTIIASSGDGGGFDTGTGYLSGSFPATDPYVLAVNGLRTSATDASGSVFPTQTTYGILNLSIEENPQTPFFYNYPVHADQATKISSETYWYVPFTNETLKNAPPEASGGFDTSYWFNQTWMEHGYTVPDLGRSLGSGVAAEADFNQSIYFDGSMQYFWGGTSFACPTTAGILALVEDYLAHHGHNSFLGDGNGPIYDVANAYWNGNLTLKPFYDVVSKAGVSANGTSYWGNFGVANGYELPTAQKFPYTAQGNTTYGNTLPGWDFPTGWGQIIVSNFAQDLNTLESLPAQFSTVNSAGTAYDNGAWDWMQLNHTYTIHLNASGPFAASGPYVDLVFHGADGVNTSLPRPAITPTFTPSSGYDFTLDTGALSEPGFIVMTAGNATETFAAFAYDWISYPAATGALVVSVTAPTSGSILSGYPEFNPWPFGYNAPTIVDPNCCTTPNTFTVHVTLNGAPVYDAWVTAQVPSLSVLAWQGSRVQAATQSQGNPHELTNSTLSGTYTNLNGDAIVYTWNLVAPSPYFVNATYGGAKGGTVYNITPGLNVKTTDTFGGQYSQFSTLHFVLQDLRQPTTTAEENLWAPNYSNQTGYYNLIYAWQGEVLPLSANDFAGNAVSGAKVWLGDMDFGGANKFYNYEPSFGVVGVTNVSGTSNYTGPSGNTTIFIPDNQTANNFFQYPNGQTAGFAYVAASMPGQFNRTFSYTEPCVPANPNNPKQTITCEYNDTLQRNYSAVPVLIGENPVNVTTQTSSDVARSFFGTGSNISVKVNVQLPSNDPFVTGYGYNWLPGLEHVVSVNAFVSGDGTGFQYAGDFSPGPASQWQNFTVQGNLSGTYGPGTHDLKIIAVDSLGHIFTRDDTFIVGGINITNLGLQNTYTVLPYVLNWTYVIPVDEMNNHTFSQSLDIRYVANGCGGTTVCPTVVNYTIKIKDGVTTYNQSLNTTLLNLKGFYAGASELPPGQYQIIIWLNANHSGSIASQVDTQLVFDNVQGQINGPDAGAVVPLGNVTISYAYSGQYIENATLFVFPAGTTTSPVFRAGAFVPGLSGLRGGASTWTAVTPGAYEILLSLGTPYGSQNISEPINVSEVSGTAFLNQSHGNGILGGLTAASAGTLMAIIAGLVGLLVGLFLAPAIRGGPSRTTAAGGRASPPPWQEDAKPAGKLTCSVCHEEFETPFAMHQHQKIAHGIEE